MLAGLTAHQQEIRRLVAEAQRIVSSTTPVVSDRLMHLRWQLVRALRSYQLFKHTEIFDPLERNADPHRASLAAEMRVRCINAGEAYNQHVQEWTLTKADDDWAIYCRRSAEMLTAITEHLKQEAADADLLLRGVSRTRKP